MIDGNYKKNGNHQSNGNQDQEEWLKLCEQASVEEDPDKLVALTTEICRLLDERRKKLENTTS